VFAVHGFMQCPEVSFVSQAAPEGQSAFVVQGSVQYVIGWSGPARVPPQMPGEGQLTTAPQTVGPRMQFVGVHMGIPTPIAAS
jgi:hypothetical protein